MKTAFVGFILLIGGVIAWAYNTQPDAFQDALADFKHDPNGTRALLEQSQKQCTDLSTANTSLGSENDALKATVKSLKDEVAQLKAASLAAASPAATSPAASLSLGAQKIFVPPSPLPAQANWTWTTLDGKTYNKVVVKQVEADCVTILDDEGGARIDIITLPADIQKQLNFDPDLAKIAGEARVKDEIASQALLEKEKQEHQQQLKTEAATDQKPAAPTLSDADKAEIQHQIRGLEDDISDKLREMASVYTHEGYAHAVSSQSSYRDIVAQEIDQVNDLRTKLGLPTRSVPVYYPYYPYYYYYYP
ncbi:MAG: hypothetical protein LV481_12260 [Methylacidiphilales bacterium]|nr:hypothetical protein [Candidatus Methylacidiphilales bacterium]